MGVLGLGRRMVGGREFCSVGCLFIVFMIFVGDNGGLFVGLMLVIGMLRL